MIVTVGFILALITIALLWSIKRYDEKTIKSQRKIIEEYKQIDAIHRQQLLRLHHHYEGACDVIDMYRTWFEPTYEGSLDDD